MRAVWITARKDFARAWRDPLALLMWFAIPLILGVMMTAVFGGGNPTPQGRLLLADQDDTFLSNLIEGAFSREPLSKMVLVEKVTLEQGRARIANGGASALLVIPKGFADAVRDDAPFQLELVTNPSQRILPNMIRDVLSILVDGEFYLQRVGGDELKFFRQRAQRDRPPNDVEIALYSVGIRHAVDRLRKYLMPPVIQLEIVAKEYTGPSFAALFLPTMMFLAVLFASSAMAADIWRERNMGTLRRLFTTQAPAPAFLAGRLLFVLAVFGGVAVVAVAAARFIANVPVASVFGAVAWMVLSGGCFYLLLLLLVMQADTQRGANILSNLVVFPLSMLGGCFFPFEIMPGWMARIGTKLPNGMAVVQFHAILNGSAKAKELTVTAGVLLAFSAIAFGLSLRKLRRGFAI